MPRSSLPKLPKFLHGKIYKTGTTRGASNGEIYQDRVPRASTVLIPYPNWKDYQAYQQEFKEGFIVLISPTDYFKNPPVDVDLKSEGLVLGQNALVFYHKPDQWDTNNPDDAPLNWQYAKCRTAPLGGNYVARISATTAAKNSDSIIRGFTQKFSRGAGIRVFEYANASTVEECRKQLEALVWLCPDSEEVMAKYGMTPDDVVKRKNAMLQICDEQGLLDFTRLIEARVINKNYKTVCPLCLEEFSAQGFFTPMQQAEGRTIHNLTGTELNLFHIEGLQVGVFNHRKYNVGWGHHHCNTVVRDYGIKDTLAWMTKVLKRNADEGHSDDVSNDN